MSWYLASEDNSSSEHRIKLMPFARRRDDVIV